VIKKMGRTTEQVMTSFAKNYMKLMGDMLPLMVITSVISRMIKGLPHREEPLFNMRGLN
jgi:hypothetical protein